MRTRAAVVERVAARRRFVMLAVSVPAVVLLAWVAGQLDWGKAPPQRAKEAFVFRDGFEKAKTLADLFPRDLRRWHGAQRESATGLVENVVALTRSTVHAGGQALKLRAVAYDGKTASKADVMRGGLRFVRGDDAWFSGWFFLDGKEDAANVFLWDLEASGKYKSPGRRLYLQEGGALVSDLGKWWTKSVFRQPRGREVPFPRDRWVPLVVHLHLSEGADGAMEVWQDGARVLDARGQTLPTASTVYDRIQVGLTANGNRRHAHTLYLDDVALSNRPLPTPGQQDEARP